MKLEHQQKRTPQLKTNMINGFLEIVGQQEYETLFPVIKGSDFRTDDQNAENRIFDLARAGMELHRALGERSSNGIMLRAGRAAFRRFLQGKGEILGLNALEFRLMPTRIRIMKGLKILAEKLQEDLVCRIDLADEKKHWSWVMDDCSECKGRTSASPICFFMHGFLFEFMYWTGNGKVFPVTEITCRAAGGQRCTFQISKDFLVQ